MKSILTEKSFRERVASGHYNSAVNAKKAIYSAKTFSKPLKKILSDWVDAYFDQHREVKISVQASLPNATKKNALRKLRRQAPRTPPKEAEIMVPPLQPTPEKHPPAPQASSNSRESDIQLGAKVITLVLSCEKAKEWIAILEEAQKKGILLEDMLPTFGAALCAKESLRKE